MTKFFSSENSYDPYKLITNCLHLISQEKTVVSQKSYLCTGSHNFQDPTFGLIVKPITIGNGVWIATDCFVAPGVKIGSNTVIGARSSVFKDIPAGMVALCTPCKPHYPREIKV